LLKILEIFLPEKKIIPKIRVIWNNYSVGRGATDKSDSDLVKRVRLDYNTSHT
jgi:hypothetical protein